MSACLEGAGAPDLDALFRSHSRYVANIAVRLLGYDAQVDDIVQDVFVQALTGLKELRDPACTRAWLKTVAIRTTARYLRTRRLRSFFGKTSPQEVLACTATPEERLLIRRIYSTLDRMPVRLRVAWFLRYMEAESLESVAAICGCSLATAKRRVASAKKQIDRELGDG